MHCTSFYFFFFFFNDTATTEIYTLSLHDALPICRTQEAQRARRVHLRQPFRGCHGLPRHPRSEEHTSELQSRLHLVCRLLLEKKKKTDTTETTDETQSISDDSNDDAISSHHVTTH